MAYGTDAERRMREQEARWQRRWDERERAWEREREHLKRMADFRQQSAERSLEAAEQRAERYRREVDSTEEWAHMVLAMFLLTILGLTVLVVHFATQAG